MDIDPVTVVLVALIVLLQVALWYMNEARQKWKDVAEQYREQVERLMVERRWR